MVSVYIWCGKCTFFMCVKCVDFALMPIVAHKYIGGGGGGGWCWCTSSSHSVCDDFVISENMADDFRDAEWGRERSISPISYSIPSQRCDVGRLKRFRSVTFHCDCEQLFINMESLSSPLWWGCMCVCVWLYNGEDYSSSTWPLLFGFYDARCEILGSDIMKDIT